MRLLVLLGAGSTAHAGAPSTRHVTDRIRRIPDEPIRTIVKCLDAQRGKDGFDFETVLACLEELDEFDLRRKHPQAWEFVGGILSAFAEVRPNLASLTGFFVARLKLINSVSEIFVRKTGTSSSDQLQAFFDQLKNEFDLTVVTLNYDDMIDRAAEGVWYDGFEPSGRAGDPFRIFGATNFRRRSMEHSAVLLHLHGSVRFGFGPDGGASEIVKYASGAEALKSVIYPSSGVAPRHAPIISGQHKDRWMTTVCVPFGYYHNALVNTVCECPRLLVAGYSCRDRHINAWISEEHRRIHGHARRLVWIDPGFPAISIPSLLALRGTEGNFPPADTHTGQIISHLKR